MKNESNNLIASPSIRNLQILELLGRQRRAMTPAEIIDELKLPKPTVHRLLAYLEEQGFLAKNVDGKSYLPGARFREMAIGAMHASLSSLPSRNVLIWLNQQIGETCNLAVPDNDAMVYVDRVETQWPLRIALHIGSRVPLHATAAGKVTLSLLSEEAFERYLLTGDKQSFTNKTIVDTTMLREEIELVRVRGFATDQEELVDGMIAVAVPVMDALHNFCATLSFHAPTQRLSLEQGLTHLENLRQAAEKLGKFI